MTDNKFPPRRFTSVKSAWNSPMVAAYLHSSQVGFSDTVEYLSVEEHEALIKECEKTNHELSVLYSHEIWRTAVAEKALAELLGDASKHKDALNSIKRGAEDDV